MLFVLGGCQSFKQTESILMSLRQRKQHKGWGGAADSRWAQPVRGGQGAVGLGFCSPGSGVTPASSAEREPPRAAPPGCWVLGAGCSCPAPGAPAPGAPAGPRCGSGGSAGAGAR